MAEGAVKDLIELAAGPAMLGVSGLFVYARSVLDSDRRVAGKGWLTVGAGAVIVGWTILFIVLAAPTVVESWKPRGAVDANLVLLSATWVLAIGLTVLTLVYVPRALQYLVDCYPQGSLPVILRPFSRMQHRP